MRDITTGTTVPVTPPFFVHLVRARKNRTREKHLPRHPVPDPTNATSVLTGAAPGATSGRFVLRASLPVCRPLPARRLQATRTGSLTKVSRKQTPSNPKPGSFLACGRGAFLLPLSFLFFWFSLFLLGSSSFFFFSSFSLFSHKSARGGAPCAPRKDRTRRVCRSGAAAPPGHGKSRHAHLQQGQFNYRKKK